MKKIIFILSVIFYSTCALSNDAVYFIDIDKVLNDSIYGKKIVKKLNNINAVNIEEIKKNESELKNIEDEINKVKNVVKEEELNKKINEFKKKLIAYREQKDLKIKNFNNLKNKELEIFFKKITPFIEEFMENNSIKIIIEKKNILIANENYNKTNALINFLNTKIQDG